MRDLPTTNPDLRMYTLDSADISLTRGLYEFGGSNGPLQWHYRVFLWFLSRYQIVLWRLVGRRVD